MLDGIEWQATLDGIERRALAALRPPPRLKLSDWIERNICLPDGVSSLPGAVRLWPFQREIADAIGDPAIERVTLVKPVRVGFTTLLTGALGAYVANDPAPILCLLPTEADARDYMVSEVEPIFSASPALADVIGDSKDEAGRNTILSRRFPGGSLKIVAAKAPRNLRRHTARILSVDEADGMEPTVEGPPIELAERRTMCYADRKIVIGSTPLFESTSTVLHSYAQSDMRVFEVPCPECGDHHEIAWENIQWPEGEPTRAHYVCASCGSLLANASWGKLAVEFLKAKVNPNPGSLQAFVNTILAQGWRESGKEVDDAALAARAEAFSLEAVPAEVLALTAGVDVQRDRLEVTLIGWARDDTAFVLGHMIIWGQPGDDATWAELDDVLKTRHPHELGGAIGLDAAAIDSGDGETMKEVYRFCFPRATRRVLAIKGVDGNRPWIEKSKQKVQGGALWIVGVDGVKSHLTARLARPNSLRFSNGLPAAWFEQLASERVVVRYSRGQPRRRFERIPGRRAETLDCVVYAFAARQILNVNWDARAEALRNPDLAAAPQTRPRTIRSDWMDR